MPFAAALSLNAGFREAVTEVCDRAGAEQKSAKSSPGRSEGQCGKGQSENEGDRLADGGDLGLGAGGGIGDPDTDAAAPSFAAHAEAGDTGRVGADPTTFMPKAAE